MNLIKSLLPGKKIPAQDNQSGACSSRSHLQAILGLILLHHPPSLKASKGKEATQD